jgi:DNA recombination protein RmuC
VFQSPKLRGNLGELILENLLSQMLPANAFALQHGFSDGSKVDAVILVGGHAVPVDSKFPLERFRRIYDPETPEDQKARLKKEFLADVKKHVDSIADKYIRPDEGTFDFALMYVPSETVYYEVVAQQGEGSVIIDHARSRRVVPVSPNSLYAYLQVIVFGLKGLEIEKNALEILERLKKVQVDFAKFFEHFTRIGTGIDALREEYQDSVKRFELLKRKMEKVTGEVAE